jgi:hypothetical protein
MSETLKNGAVQAAETVVATAILATPPGQAAVAGATAAAAAAAPAVALAAVGVGTFKATLYALETLEKLFTRK